MAAHECSHLGPPVSSSPRGDPMRTVLRPSACGVAKMGSTVSRAIHSSAVALIFALSLVPAPSAQSAQAQSPTISPAKAPSGTETRPVEWVHVAAPGVGVMLAAVARPAGVGPFAAVVVLHGSHGFAHEYVRLARDLAQRGLLAVAPCWFTGGGGAGARFVTPISCPDAPPMPIASSAEARRILDALVQTTRTLPDVRPDRIGLVGHSRGGGAALHYVLGAGRVQAVVMDSAGYPSELVGRASEMKAPILMLHGVGDSPADGGSALTHIQMARGFEAALVGLSFCLPLSKMVA